MNLALQKSPLKDANDEPCALVIISTDFANLKIYSSLNLVDVILKTGEVWVYLTAGDKYLQFEKAGYANLKYDLPLTLQNNLDLFRRINFLCLRPSVRTKNVSP